MTGYDSVKETKLSIEQAARKIAYLQSVGRTVNEVAAMNVAKWMIENEKFSNSTDAVECFSHTIWNDGLVH